MMKLFEKIFDEARDKELKLAQDIWQIYVDYAGADWHTLHSKKLDLVGDKQYKQGCPLCDNYFHSKLDCSRQCPLCYQGKTCYTNGSLCRLWKYAPTQQKAKEIAEFVVGRCKVARVARQNDDKTNLDNIAFEADANDDPFMFLHESEVYGALVPVSKSEDDNEARQLPHIEDEPIWW